MAKSALNRQTASLAADFKAQGINVALIAVHPGRVPTRMSGSNGSVDLGESAKGMIKIVKSSIWRTLDVFFATPKRVDKAFLLA
jgi:NAD(P)-dependent dehydrogenase (short-subunit alcohol dehydrogenase family)